MKDKDELELKSNVVYNIPCKDCNEVYIGHTKRYLKERIREHKTNMNNDPKTQTALSKHQWNNSLSFNFDKITILSNEKNYKKRITIEMLFNNKNCQLGQ